MIGDEKKQINIFYSYAHEDENLRSKLSIHLSLLSRQGLITQWHDRDISAGTVWADQLDQHMDTANIILLLISPDFLASDYCYSIEVTRALARHAAGEARVIPILLRPVDWEHAPFAVLQVLPQNKLPITSWKNQDLAFQNIAIQLRKIVEELQQKEIAKSSIFEMSQQSSRHMQLDRDEELHQVANEFRLALKRVSELKNIHDKLDEIELNLAVVIESLRFFMQERGKEKKQGSRWFILKQDILFQSLEVDIRTFNYINTLWQNVVLKIDDLVYFASQKMEVLEDERFTSDSGMIKGALWVVRPFLLQQSIEAAIRDRNINDMQELTDKLLTECRDHLHRIDKRLLEAVEQLDRSSSLLIGYSI